MVFEVRVVATIVQGHGRVQPEDQMKNEEFWQYFFLLDLMTIIRPLKPPTKS